MTSYDEWKLAPPPYWEEPEEWESAKCKECEYIPRPRYEDGLPVQFGDDIEIHNQSGLLDKGIIRSFHPNKGPVWMLSLVGCDHERLVRFDPKTCIIKRPAPKVLDADGVEIEVGDTVFEGDNPKPLKVIHIYESGDIQAVGDGGMDSKLDSSQYYHDRPVFDADGKRICKGDTVWDKKTGEQLTVVSPKAYTKDGTVVVCKDGAPGELWYAPEDLTHREPDSLEKLRDDLYTLAARDDGDIEVEIVIFADRLTALIERG